MKNTKSAKVLGLCLLAGAVAVPALYGCGGSKAKPAEAAGGEPKENSTLPEPSAISPAPTAPAESATAATNDAPSPLGQVLTTDAGQIQKIYDAATSAPAATLKQNGAAGGDPLAKGIRDAAKKLVAGMQPDGPLAMGSIKEKQHLQTDVTLAPGKCYSIVGFSKKVKDLDLYLFLAPGFLSAQDLTDDNKPIIGGPPQPLCPDKDKAITYKLDILADSGGGDVAVQLFSKGK
jgi:hypothetical protein